jgi:hypothetical protein
MGIHKRHLPMGKLYEFNVTQPIPFYLLEELYDHPKGNRICRKNACVHPQLAFHGTTEEDPPYDLSIEVTMNTKYFNDYIQLSQTYLVDTNILYDNRSKLFSEFNPVEAIIINEASIKDKSPNMNNGGKKRTRKRTPHKSR